MDIATRKALAVGAVLLAGVVAMLLLAYCGAHSNDNHKPTPSPAPTVTVRSI